MSRLIRCVEGHIFSSDQGPRCPVCGASTSASPADEATEHGTQRDQPPRRHAVVAGIGATGVLVVAGVAAFLLWPPPAPPSTSVVTAKEQPPVSDQSKAQPGDKVAEPSKTSAEVKSAEPLAPKKEEVTKKDEVKSKPADSSATPKTETKGIDVPRDIASLMPRSKLGGPGNDIADIPVWPGQALAEVRAAYGMVMDPARDTSGVAWSVLPVPHQGLSFNFMPDGSLLTIEIHPRYRGRATRFPRSSCRSVSLRTPWILAAPSAAPTRSTISTACDSTPTRTTARSA